LKADSEVCNEATVSDRDGFVLGLFESGDREEFDAGKEPHDHRRTNPDKSKNNNWSTKGNTNPYTGKKGTKDPYKSPSTRRRKIAWRLNDWDLPNITSSRDLV
jgi:hypothetical protein